VILRDTRVGELTVRLVEFVTLPRVAVRVVVPWATLLTIPDAETVATLELAVVQLTEELRF
jgi:hypothetical protein